jgi:uncharacterized membrane protein YphA (DoxX/SURF4 family)
MSELVVSARLILAAAFLIAGVSKLSSRSRLREALYLAGTIPPRLIPAVRLLLPPLEIGIAALLLTGFAHPLGALLAGVALLGFLLATWAPAVSGDEVPCGCFGAGEGVLDRGTLARNAVLFCYTLLVTFASRGTGARDSFDAYFGQGSARWASWVDTVSLALLPLAVGGIFSIWQRASSVLEIGAPEAA